MRQIIAVSAIALSLMSIVSVRGYQTHPQPMSEDIDVRFVPLQVFIDSGPTPLAAWQFELKAPDDVKIVGVENGEHEAFAEAPYYDPAALMNNRIIIAAFSTADQLPNGKTRVATVHLQVIGDTEPEYKLTLTVAGDREGSEIPATITYFQGEEK